MIDRDSPVTEDELHAYIDGELPAERKAAIATWLSEHPEQAAMVASWRAQAWSAPPPQRPKEEASRERYTSGRIGTSVHLAGTGWENGPGATQNYKPRPRWCAFAPWDCRFQIEDCRLISSVSSVVRQPLR